MTNVNVTGRFNPDGDDLRIVIAHSTEDDLGERTATELKAKLNPKIVIAAEGRIATFSDLLNLVQTAGHFDVLVLIAHGNKVLNTVKLYADVDSNNRPLRVKAAELAVLNGSVDDVLCLFGICHFGSDDLAAAVCTIAGALACVAPRPGETIRKTEIVEGFSALLNKMQVQKAAALDTGALHTVLLPTMSRELRKKLSVYPPA